MSARLFPVNFMNVETMAPMDLLQVDLARRAAVSVSQLRALEALYPIKWDDQQGLLESIERFEDDMKAVVKFTNHLSEKCKRFRYVNNNICSFGNGRGE